MGASVFTNLKLDGADERTILYQASNVGYPAKAVFIYPHFSAGQLDNSHLEGNARVQLKAGHFVQVIGGENFCNENGYGVEFDGGGTFLGQGIIMESAYMKGTGTEDGYRLIGCVEDTGAAGHRILEFVGGVLRRSGVVLVGDELVRDVLGESPFLGGETNLVIGHGHHAVEASGELPFLGEVKLGQWTDHSAVVTKLGWRVGADGGCHGLGKPHESSHGVVRSEVC